MNHYPTIESRRSNLLHRPIGVGVQGLADVFFMMDVAYHSKEALEINKNIFETIYHAAVECSVQLAKERKNELISFTEDEVARMPDVYGLENKESLDPPTQRAYDIVRPSAREFTATPLGSYCSFSGSPMSEGKFQFDLWLEKPDSERYDWESLRTEVITHGIRNSLLVAPMPTASTAQILGNNECFEPITSNIYIRRTLAGEFMMVNKHLVSELKQLGIWTKAVKDQIIENRGSVQTLTGLSPHMKLKYKTVWEMPMQHLIDMSRDRAIYVCQSQSLNLWIETPTHVQLTRMHFYSWEKGLKTGMYYLRRKPKHQPQQFNYRTSATRGRGTMRNVQCVDYPVDPNPPSPRSVLQNRSSNSGG